MLYYDSWKKTVSLVGACICWMIALAFWKGRQSGGGPSQQLIEVGRLHVAKSGIDDKRKPFVQGYMWIEQQLVGGRREASNEFPGLDPPTTNHRTVFFFLKKASGVQPDGVYI